MVQWIFLLQQYWKRFESWCPYFTSIAGEVYGLSPPIDSPKECWRKIELAAGGLAEVTAYLVDNFKITIFGSYQCHQSNSPHN
jgi:hypothetical protein